jgi:signal transduction histidine kinase
MATPATGSLALPVAAFRGVLLLLCVVLAVLPDGVNTQALGRAVVLAVAAAVIAWRVDPRAPGAVPVTLLEAVLAGATIPATGGAESPLLPYLLAPGLALGLAGGWRAAALGALVSTAAITGVALAVEQTDEVLDFVTAVGQWVLLSFAMGVLAAGALRLGAAAPGAAERYLETRELLRQLKTVTKRLPGGLDAPSAASALLESCAQVLPSSRSAVLARAGGEALVPLAVRGTRRVPWRAPLTAPGPLQRAWEGRQPVVDLRKPDKLGRRQGSALAVFPLLDEEEPFGLVILESLQAEPFPPSAVEELTEVVRRSALQIETALLFEDVRAAATLEERDRLAREMHDGMAQDIAFLGYQLDALKGRAAKVDPALATEVGEVRSQLTALISDIRLSITDLRTSVDADRGLGSALSSYVRAVGAGKDITVHLSLQESTFRLPGDQEVLLFQVAQAVAQDVRRGRRSGQLWVTLSVDPPSARLQVEHDGPMQDVRSLGLEDHAAALARAGGTLEVTTGRSGGPQVVAVLGGGDDAGHGAAGR